MVFKLKTLMMRYGSGGKKLEMEASKLIKLDAKSGSFRGNQLRQTLRKVQKRTLQTDAAGGTQTGADSQTDTEKSFSLPYCLPINTYDLALAVEKKTNSTESTWTECSADERLHQVTNSLREALNNFNPAVASSNAANPTDKSSAVTDIAAEVNATIAGAGAGSGAGAGAGAGAATTGAGTTGAGDYRYIAGAEWCRYRCRRNVPHTSTDQLNRYIVKISTFVGLMLTPRHRSCSPIYVSRHDIIILLIGIIQMMQTFEYKRFEIKASDNLQLDTLLSDIHYL